MNRWKFSEVDTAGLPLQKWCQITNEIQAFQANTINSDTNDGKHLITFTKMHEGF